MSGLLRTCVENVGDYTIKIVRKLPKRGNYVVLYIEEAESITHFNLYQEDGTYLKLPIQQALMGYTVDTLPQGNQGDRAFVTDALDPQYLSRVIGGGNRTVQVFHDGTDWIT